MDPALQSIVATCHNQKLQKHAEIAKTPLPPHADDAGANTANPHNSIEAEIGAFTNRIVLCKEKDLQYYLRMIVMRLNNEFHLINEAELAAFTASRAQTTTAAGQTPAVCAGPVIAQTVEPAPDEAAHAT